MSQVQIATNDGRPVACRGCGQPFQPLIDQYIVCGCQNSIGEMVSSTAAHVHVVTIPFRNNIVAWAVLARACQELARYIPGMANVNPG
jgi:hypothetical protein